MSNHIVAVAKCGVAGLPWTVHGDHPGAGDSDAASTDKLNCWRATRCMSASTVVETGNTGSCYTDVVSLNASRLL
jgi:hypothetical protein